MKSCQVTVITSVLLLCTSSAWGISTKIIAGNDDEVCREIRDLSRNISDNEYWVGTWPESFGPIEWKHETYPTITAEKKPWDVPFKYVSVDIDNDGVQEVIIVYSGMIRSVNFDWLYLFTPEQFRQAQVDKTVGKLFETVPILNPRNEVRFSDGLTAVPVELQIWHYKGTQYLLLKEHYFGKQKPGLPNSLFVAKLSRASQQWDDLYKVHRLVPELRCRLVSQ